MPPVLRALILWLHLLAVIVWIGGLLFQVLVVFPTLSRAGPSAAWIRLGLSLEVRFRLVMWPAVGLVLFTGLVNLLYVWHATVMAGSSLPSTFVPILTVKLLLVLSMLALQAVHQFMIQPRRLAIFATLAAGVRELPPAFRTLQHLALALAVALVSLAAGVVLCAVLLRGV